LINFSSQLFVYLIPLPLIYFLLLEKRKQKNFKSQKQCRDSAKLKFIFLTTTTTAKHIYIFTIKPYSVLGSTEKRERENRTYLLRIIIIITILEHIEIICAKIFFQAQQ